MSGERAIVVAAVFSVGLSVACDDPAVTPVTQRAAVPFREVAAEVGLDFTHFNGMHGEFRLPEIVGSGLAWLDYDGDGDLDLYAVQGTVLDPAVSPQQARPPWPGEGQPGDRLFRNDLTVDASGKPSLRFTDVTESARIPRGGYGMGVAAGDYDNDGWVDLYVAQLGENRLLRNDGNGGFTDATAASGLGDPFWSVSAAFVDIDRDGWLDLFVADYLDWSLAADKDCFMDNGLEDYCGPASYLPVPDRLFLNRGDGTFADVTAAAGIASEYGAGLGVVSGDFDGDGSPDLYVANDGLPNQLWINRGDGRFANDALLAGCALNADGKAEASMGIDAADFDEDGDEDLFMAHLDGETNTLYVNDGRGGFADRSAFSGLGPASHAFTGFGAGWIDYDNDGWLDIAIANGAVRTMEPLVRAGDPYPFHQTNQLFRNTGGGSYVEIERGLGPESAVSRGAAFGDVDNDGDVDIAVSNNAGALRLFLNETGNQRSWIGLRLLGEKRAMLGARVELTTGSGRRLVRRARRDGSYASSSDPRVLVGLGGDEVVERIVVRWPGGAVETWDALQSGRWHTLRRGAGTAAG